MTRLGLSGFTAEAVQCPCLVENCDLTTRVTDVTEDDQRLLQIAGRAPVISRSPPNLPEPGEGWQRVQQDGHSRAGQVAQVPTAGNEHQAVPAAGQQRGDLGTASGVVQDQQYPLPGQRVL